VGRVGFWLKPGKAQVSSLTECKLHADFRVLIRVGEPIGDSTPAKHEIPWVIVSLLFLFDLRYGQVTSRQFRINPKLLFLGCVFAQLCNAEKGKLVVKVEDVQQRAIKNVEVGIDGIGGSGITGNDGKIVLTLGNATKDGDWVSLYLIHSPPGKDLVIISPWDRRTMVPPFADKAENFVRIVVVQRGDRTALESGTVLAALTAKINKENAAKSSNKSRVLEDPVVALNAIAKQYGFDPAVLDRQIRAWGGKTSDPYEAGLAALYQRNFPEASNRLRTSLEVRENKLATDQKAVEADQNAVADAAFFLGSSLYEQGRYRESVEAYGQCLRLKPNEPSVLNNLALSLTGAGDYSGAELLYNRVLAADEKAPGTGYPDVARDLNNLAELLRTKGDYAGAEPLDRRALAIAERSLGPDHPELGDCLNNLSLLLLEEGDYGQAEPFSRRALANYEKTLGPDNPNVAAALSNLAGILNAKGDNADVERLLRRALTIDEKALSPEHPTVATNLNNLAALLRAKGEYADAERLFRRALAIDENTLGPDHPSVANTLSNLAELLDARGEYADAELLCRRAVAIDEKALGPDHPHLGAELNILAGLLLVRGDYADAEPLCRRALAIYERAFGPYHPNIAITLNNLAGVLNAKGDRAGAEQLYRRALTIDLIALGPAHPMTILLKKHLDEFLEAHVGEK
jgi:tetratricopeptide (TPR) repeat protein